jgi:dienelactone hydrolase
VIRNCIAAVLATAAMVVPAAAADPVDPNFFARVAQVDGVSMSMEGDLLVGIVAMPNDPYTSGLAVWDISNIQPGQQLAPKVITPSGDRTRFVAAAALKAGKLIAIGNQPWTGSLQGCGEGRTTGATKTWVRRLFLTDAAAKDFSQPLEGNRPIGISADTQKCFELAGQSGIAQFLPLDPDHVVAQRLNTESLEVEYFKVNLRTGAAEFMYRDIGDTRIALTDRRDGKILARQRINAVGGNEYDIETFVLDEATGRFELEGPLTWQARSRHTVDLIGKDVETGKYIVRTDKFSDKAAFYLYDHKTDAFESEPLFAHADFDVGSILFDDRPETFGQILGFSYLGGAETSFLVDPELKAVVDGLKAAFPGLMVDLAGTTKDRSKILFSTSSPRHPPSFYLLLDKSKVVAVGASRPWIDPDALGEQTLVYYTARDGLKIPALLTTPAGWKKGDAPPPAVVMPHGGPWARDVIGWDFSGWPQYLSSLGYAVLQPQYRGSTGWGRQLWLAGDAQWGKAMQDDKDDGANWMVAEGYAAPGRLAIYGYSYGGFAAFAATVREGGPFKCAIAGAGVANLTKIGNNWSSDRIQRAIQGRTVTGMDPQANVAKANLPILIFHGERDVRVPLFHSQDFYQAVRNRVDAKLVVLEDMGHQGDLWTPDNYRDTLKYIGDYLQNDCKL